MSKINVNGVDYTLAELQTLAKAGVLNTGQKHDTSGTTQTAQSLHGTNAGGYNGLFSEPGVRPDMWNTTPRTDSLFSQIPLMKSEYTNEILEIQTGVTDGSGTNATGFCATPPTGGYMKTCQQVYTFGEFRLGTRVINLANVGTLVNRADTPRNLLNSARVDNRLVPDIMQNMIQDTRSQLATEMYVAGIQIERSFDKTSITGSTAQASTDTDLGFIKEFNGLDNLVKTGYVDAVTSQACPAADSKVITFGANINNTIAGGDGRDLVEAMVDLYTAQMDLAEMLNISVQFKWFMTRAMFRVVTEVWACNYATSRCSQGDWTLNVEATNVVTMRDNMQTGRYLLIGGVQVPVIFSSGIPQGGGVTANSFTQDIYLLPITANGRPALWLEFFDMGNPYAQEFNAYTNNRKILNGGLYSVNVYETGECVQLAFNAKARLILDTPFLAGRIDDITFTDLRGTRTPYPTDSFYANGGVTYRT